MSGDYTRFTFDPLKRYSGVLMQQGRVQLDADWNEDVDILRRRIRTTALDVLGPLGVPYATAPNSFLIGWLPGPPTNLSIGTGRLYVDGMQIEAFAEDNATYTSQPFYPAPLPLPTSGGAVVYLDVWDREVTAIEDPSLPDVALGGPDTTTRLQTVWQLRVDARDNAKCGLSVGDPPSAGRLTSRAAAPPATDDPCILPPASGYRGLENRLYRVEIHTGGPLGTARFKWSRDNGSIVSVVRDIAVSGTKTTLSVNRIGRDQFMRFRVGDWVTVTDDHRELMGEAGEMALISDIDESNRRIVVDGALPTGTGRAFGANAAQIAARHTRVQRWDQTSANFPPLDATGVIPTTAGPIDLEDGIKINFATTSPGGSFRVGDYWVFWARTATAQVEELTNAPPRGIIHRYMQIAAITGIGGAATPVVTDCRPPPAQPQPQPGDTDCCCTIIVRPGESIQDGIDRLPEQGGCVCLKTGLHGIEKPLRITRGSIVLKAESPGTAVHNRGEGPALVIGDPTGKRIDGIDVLGIDFAASVPARNGVSIILIEAASRVRVSHCGLQSLEGVNLGGLQASNTDRLSVVSCHFSQLMFGLLVQDRCPEFQADSNIIALGGRERAASLVGIAYMKSAFACRITRNAVSGAMFGIVVRDDMEKQVPSLADGSIVDSNSIVCPDFGNVFAAGTSAVSSTRIVAIDIAASRCSITENRIAQSDPANIGIRVTGSACEIVGNQIVSFNKTFNLQGPIAIVMGVTDPDSKGFVLSGIISHNAISGIQHGIICSNAGLLVIEHNLVGSLAGFAIMGMRLSASEITGNRVIGALSAVFLANGRHNRIAGNDCRNGQSGLSLFREAGPQLDGNRLDTLGLWGVFALQTAARLDITGNRVVNCASQMPNTAYGIGCIQVFGEANISNNEVMDAGSTGGDNATSKVDYGIFGDLVLEARVEGNLVTYSNIAIRSPQREDRALKMRGMFEFSAGRDEFTFGFAIQILGNKFIGNGRTALVELFQGDAVNGVVPRFERVIFSNNYCSHLTQLLHDNERPATVWLVGGHAIVMGNHIKAMPRIPSVNFNGVPGPFIGNVTAGGAINHGDFPVTESAFNVLAP
jgi:Family of unknown function (DUF6519)/Right handed beta helix region